MTGDAPQPGDKPRADGDPWSDPDADIAWWRTDGDRPVEIVGGAGDDRERRDDPDDRDDRDDRRDGNDR